MLTGGDLSKFLGMMGRLRACLRLENTEAVDVVCCGLESSPNDNPRLGLWSGAESSGKPNVDWAAAGFRDDI